MRPRILVTGIPGHYTRLANGAHGLSVSYAERQKQPETKDDFLQEMRNISNTGNYLIGAAPTAPTRRRKPTIG